VSAAQAPALGGVRPAEATGWPLARVLGSEVVEELRTVLRDPLTLFFSVGMPVGFFALFTSLFGGQAADAGGGGGLTAGATMLATYGTFGVTGVALITPGIGLATDRDRGWLRVKAVSATPVPVTLVAKAVATLPHSLGVLAMTAVGAAISGTQLDPATWLRLVGVLLLGSLPFVLLGLSVGALASGSATTAVLQAVFLPSAVASGLWFPLEMLPSGVQAVAPALPTYHLAQLALAQLDGSDATGHLLALLASTAVLAAVAVLALRRVRP